MQTENSLSITGCPFTAEELLRLADIENRSIAQIGNLAEQRISRRLGRAYSSPINANTVRNWIQRARREALPPQPLAATEMAVPAQKQLNGPPPPPIASDVQRRAAVECIDVTIVALRWAQQNAAPGRQRRGVQETIRREINMLLATRRLLCEPTDLNR